MPLFTRRQDLLGDFADLSQRSPKGFGKAPTTKPQQQSTQQRAAQRRPMAPSTEAFATVQRSNEQRTADTQDVGAPTSSTPSLSSVGAAFSPAPAGSLQAQAQAAMRQFGWGPEHWDALNQLVQRESSWNPNAQNPTSTAYGLFQFLNGTWAGTGIARTSDPAQQILAGLRYIQSRYGSPQAAWQFWQQNHWY